ncbi:protein NATD1-like [Pelmatolapia mariae]|uniref:protein NATD1-like n=1 Tax=Pelmatolapia mariae TaxID=158779 RepID=UPI002FE5A156
MAFRILSRVCTLTHGLKSSQTAFSTLSSAGSLKVEHDRRNQRFTVTAGSSTADHECGVLKYRFTGEKEVDLMSTFVPETYRGHGVAALLSRAALDFVVEENLKAHVSCLYIKKYIEEQPEQRYKEFVIT